jgi:hypothetical protein
MNWDYVASWSEWVAPVATTIAAIMTAANLGSRVTGWGFVVFMVGSIHWTLLGMATGQTSLIAANGFLCVVNAVGIWRWLGVRARLDDGAQAAERQSEAISAPALLSLANIEGCEVTDSDGEILGPIRGGMVERDSGRLSYVVVACGGMGGVNETLHSVPWEDLTSEENGFRAPVTRSELMAREPLDPRNWPARIQG